jgi:ribonuclease Z
MTRPIEVIFLGTSAALPAKGQSNASYLVRLGSETLLIDCGPAILQQLDAVGVSPREIFQVFITHGHGDHALGYPMLMLWYELNPSPSVGAPLFIASDRTFEKLDVLMATAYGHISGMHESAARAVLPYDQPGHAQIHPSIMLKTLPMAHSDFAPVLGLRIETRGPMLNPRVLAFTGDTGPCDNVVPLAHNADLLVHEANFSATLEPKFPNGGYGHSTAQMAGRNAAAAHAKHLALVHLDAVYAGHETEFIAEAQSEFGGTVSVPVAGVVYSF